MQDPDAASTLAELAPALRTANVAELSGRSWLLVRDLQASAGKFSALCGPHGCEGQNVKK